MTFCEWMMGLPPGHVTGVPGLTRTQILRLLGNGCVPQQVQLATAMLLAGVPAWVLNPAGLDLAA